MKPSTTFFLCFLNVLLVTTPTSSSDSSSKLSDKEIQRIADATALKMAPFMQNRLCETLSLNSSSHSSSNSTVEHTVTHNMDLHIATIFNACKQHMHNSTSSFTQVISQNKGKVFATLMSCIYFYLYFTLQKSYKIITRKESWCNWKENINLPHLMSEPYHDIIHELILTIQKKYLLEEKQSKLCITQTFLQDLKTELQLLEQHLTIRQYVKSWYCFKLFPLIHDLDILQEKIARLYWLLDIFATWQTKEVLKDNYEI